MGTEFRRPSVAGEQRGGKELRRNKKFNHEELTKPGSRLKKSGLRCIILYVIVRR